MTAEPALFTEWRQWESLKAQKAAEWTFEFRLFGYIFCSQGSELPSSNGKLSSTSLSKNWTLYARQFILQGSCSELHYILQFFLFFWTLGVHLFCGSFGCSPIACGVSEMSGKQIMWCEKCDVYCNVNITQISFFSYDDHNNSVLPILTVRLNTQTHTHSETHQPGIILYRIKVGTPLQGFWLHFLQHICVFFPCEISSTAVPADRDRDWGDLMQATQLSRKNNNMGIIAGRCGNKQ